MPSLPEIQRQFDAAVFAEDPAIPAWIKPNGLPAQRRFAVYRNNTRLGLAEALRDGFPVVHRLVGTEFFDAMATGFVTAQPPRSGCLLDYGGEFAGFIAGFDPAARLPYLPDVARLEWAWHEAFHAAEARRLRLVDLPDLEPEHHALMSLRLQPGVRLLASPWPVLRIFEANQPDFAGDPTIDLDRETGCQVLVVRADTEVRLHALSAGAFAFLANVQRHGDLTLAFEAASAAEPDFDLTTALVWFLDQGVFAHPQG